MPKPRIIHDEYLKIAQTKEFISAKSMVEELRFLSQIGLLDLISYGKDGEGDVYNISYDGVRYLEMKRNFPD